MSWFSSYTAEDFDGQFGLVELIAVVTSTVQFRDEGPRGITNSVVCPLHC